MSTWLAIESSTSVGTVALFRNGMCVAERAVAMKGATDERLMPAVVEVLEGQASPRTIARVLVGAGPGSFTSLRVAAAIAKGLATSTSAELWALPSLGLIVPAGTTPGPVLAILDAMRGEWFAALVTVGDGGVPVAVGKPVRVPTDGLAPLAARHGARILGPSGPVDVTAAPHARGAAALVRAALAHPVDLATWEPDYGRLAEAQVKWEAANGRPLGSVS